MPTHAHGQGYSDLNFLIPELVTGVQFSKGPYWRSTDQVPQRAIAEGLISRFGATDPSDGGHSYRYSATGDWQRGSHNGDASTRVTVYGIGYDLDLFSNFTYYLNDPVHGDQIEQADHRFVFGGKVSHRRVTRWGGHSVQNTIGLQLRNDEITNVGLYHTQARVRLETTSQAAVVETTGGAYAQSEIEWTPWLRTMAGLRVDASRLEVSMMSTRTRLFRGRLD